MKHFKKVLFFLMAGFALSCTSDNEGEPERGVVVTTFDLNTSIRDDVQFGDVIGNITGRTNIGLVSFEIASQTPEGALEIDEIVGELRVANPDVINASVSPEINVVVTVKNGAVSKDSNVTIVVISDVDGDGIFLDTDPDDTNPCLPLQSAFYTDYDAMNLIWMAADCDGDGELNGDEAANGSNPYVAGTCDSPVNTVAWSGTFVYKDEFFESVNETLSSAERPILPGCGTLTLTDPLDHGGNFGPCEPDAFLEIILTFTPESEGATKGTVEVAPQDYTCDFIVSVFQGTGTYDEETQTIVLNYNVVDTAVVFEFDGVLTIAPEEE